MYWSALYNMTFCGSVFLFHASVLAARSVACIFNMFSFSIGLLAEMSANKSDRSNSPAAMSEDSRRDLLARQHRALYGNESPAFFPPGPLSDEHTKADSQAAGTPSSAVRGSSPRGVDPFGLAQAGGAPADGVQSPSRANNSSSPSSAVNASFSEQPGTSASSPGAADSPSSRQGSSKPSAGPIGSVGPIGSRPVPGQTPAGPPSNPALSKQRSTTPLPSPLGFGFTPSEAAAAAGERSTSAASNPAVTATTSASGPKDSSASVGLGWSNNGGVWGSKSGLGVQASVWG